MKGLILTSMMAAAVMFSTSIMAEDDATTSATTKEKGKQYRKGKDKGGKMGMLSPEKREKVKAIMDSLKTESEPLRKQMQEIRAKLEALRDKKMQEIKSVLTEEEFKKFQEAMKRRRKHDTPDGKGEKRKKAAESDES